MELIRTADGGVVLETFHEPSKPTGKSRPDGPFLSNLDSSAFEEGRPRRSSKMQRYLRIGAGGEVMQHLATVD
jgi:hypothetical protein